VIAEAGEEEEVLIAEIDLSVINETRKWWPFFRDRRLDSFADLQKRWLEE
jgi:N-carbamoylputrescine amidase